VEHPTANPTSAVSPKLESTRFTNDLGVVIPTITRDGNTYVVIESSIENPDEIQLLRPEDLTLLGLVDDGSGKPFCAGSNCYAVGHTRQRDVFVYFKGSDKLPLYGSKKIQGNSEDDLPITFAAGESKVLVIVFDSLLIPGFLQINQMDIVLQFNDGNSISIPLLDKLR